MARFHWSWILSSWSSDRGSSVVPLINLRLTLRRRTGERRRYYNTNKNELLAFFLQRFVKALIKHQKHGIPCPFWRRPVTALSSRHIGPSP